MISRVEFIRDIVSFDNPVQDITNHFNELNVLYSIVGGRSDVDIVSSKQHGKFGFSLLMEKEEDAMKFRDMYNGFTYSVYGEIYSVKTKLSKPDTVFITMKKKKEA